MPDHSHSSLPFDPNRPGLRRVVIEEPAIFERQRRTLDHTRRLAGYADDVSPNAHDAATFRLINQRKELDALPHAEMVVPLLDEWKHWTKMNDWASRNRLLEELTSKLRRKEASPGEIQVLITVCRPTWAAVAASLRRYGGLALDPGAGGAHRREEARRVNELDRGELDQVIQHALLDALCHCPRPFPKRFFSWLKATLAFRALDHVAADLTEHATVFPEDIGIKGVVDAVLAEGSVRAATYRSSGSSSHDEWLRTLDLESIFEMSNEYATYARTRSACERAVGKLPGRQRQVVQGYYFEAMTQEQLAERHAVASSSIRSSHEGALRNLRRDDELFDVLEAVGKVRDLARRKALEQSRRAA